MSRTKRAGVNRYRAPTGLREAQETPLSPDIHIPQHKAGPTRLADAVAEIICLGPRVGADAHLIKGMGTAAALDGTQNARIAIADHTAQIPDRASVHRQRLVAIKARGELHAPGFRRGQFHLLLKPDHEGIWRLLE